MEPAATFDHLYEHADRFDEVYSAIVEQLVDAARVHGEVLYAVPGSPMVLERSVQALRHDERADVDVLPAMSFLDVAWARLGIDPVEAGVQLVDAFEFATRAPPRTGPLLIAHTHANWLLSDVKLAAEHASGDEPVVILQRLGTRDELVTHTTWSELDRAVDADHLTCVYVPSIGVPIAAGYLRLHELARTLRERCPWDIEQTHDTLVPHLVEETFELVDAIGALDPDDPATEAAFIEELGDVLYQVEFHATIAEQEGRFSIADVTETMHDKLVRRHPHVFGDVAADDAEAVKANWDDIKRVEKQRTSVFDGVPAVAAGAGLWPAPDAQGSQGRLRLAGRGRATRQGRRGAGRASRGGRRGRSGAHRRGVGRRGDRARQRRPAHRRRRRAGGARCGRQVPRPVRASRAARRRARTRPACGVTRRSSTRCGTR